MWIKFDLDGMIFELKIKNYIPNQTLNGDWVEISHNFRFYDIINYSVNREELLLNYEVDKIRDYMENLLNDKLNINKEYEGIEPDFCFIFKPKYYLNDIPGVLYVKPGQETVDISMELKVNLWDGGLTANYFSMTFYRDEIEQFYLYLSLITKKIGIEDYRIQKLLENGVIYGDVK